MEALNTRASIFSCKHPKKLPVAGSFGDCHPKYYFTIFLCKITPAIITNAIASNDK